MDIFQKLIEIQRNGEPCALCIIVESHGSVPRHTGSKMIVKQDGTLFGSVGGGEIENRVIQEALQAIEENKPRILHYKMVDPTQGDPGICGGQAEVFVEPYLPAAEIVMIGGGHVGQAVVHLAKWLGYRVTVSDDRQEFCSPDSVPGADSYFHCSMAELPAKHKIHANSYLVLTTRGVPVDTVGLPALLKTSAPYIGIIGSKRRWLTTRKNLQNSGISSNDLDKVVSPIGLELQAESPEEIAVSILAEIMMIRKSASGLRMKMKVSPEG